MRHLKKFVLPAIAAAALGCAKETVPDEVFLLVANPGGPTLGYSPASGVTVIDQDSKFFKDLNRNGRLDPYEDWRLSPGERAADLARRISTEEICGLMLFSGHHAIPDKHGLYGGLPYEESAAVTWELTDRQLEFLGDQNGRHLLITTIQSPVDAAMWNNELQAWVEGTGHGIPVNNASAQRHCRPAAGAATAGYGEGTGADISTWPAGLGLAATFDPETARLYGDIASREYRAMGLSTTLSPQIDMGTDPRWSGIIATFGESPELSRDMGRALADGFQTSAGGSWGPGSVNAMAGHWPGGGAGEGGRDAHYSYGKFAVYPGGGFTTHLVPFTDGVLKLDGGTGAAAAIMPSYAVSWNQAADSTNYGSTFSRYMITDLLRGKYGYDGVVCTDWKVTPDEGSTPDIFAGKPWGVEELDEVQRHFMLLMAGVDQFGGNDRIGPLLEAYRMGCDEYGEEYMRRRFERSAVRLLTNMFRVGLFENPYVDPQLCIETVGNAEFMEAGYEAQLRSVVMLKNRDEVLPVRERKKVYVPMNYYPAKKGWAGKGATPERWDHAVDSTLLATYYDRTDDPGEADFALVFVNSPESGGKFGGGFDINDRTAGGNGYIPISLQYRPYLAEYARQESIAAGDPVIDPEINDRSYRWKNTEAVNDKDLERILRTCEKMDGKPVIAVVNIHRPMVFHEFEAKVDGIITRFGIPEQAVLDIISGRAEPSGLLPVQMPADMRTVEEQDEDRPFDMRCHVDTEGNIYDFAFGLDWNGVIKDHRTEKYTK